MSKNTFLWHDYETFGARPALDRPSQFAAIRTDEALEPIGEPMCWYCQPPRDALPHPQAVLITGITPQQALREGMPEYEFARSIADEMMEPGTCGVGYNSLRFDDEVTRHLLYRNFYDPYEREWRNGNSRWDLIDLMRLCYALRPQGLEWPEREPGVPSFRLEHLSAANGIAHEDAHDALSDVRATIELARRLRTAQPRLFEWGLSLRDKSLAMSMLDTVNPQPVVHTSSRIPAQRGCTSLFLPLAGVPDRPKSVIAFDLAGDPEALLELDAADIADRVFTPAADMPEGVERIPLKQIHSNKVPMLAPLGVLKGVDTGRIGLDPERCQGNAEQLRPHLAQIRSKLLQVFDRPHREPGSDPDVMLYSGGFFSGADRATMNRLRGCDPAELGRVEWPFQDPRLPEMLFRYRARNFPDSLDTEEWARWESERKEKLLEPRLDGQLGLDQFRAELAAARSEVAGDGERLKLLDELESWAGELGLQHDSAPA